MGAFGAGADGTGDRDAEFCQCLSCLPTASALPVKK
jgi:hypothetical protein